MSLHLTRYHIVGNHVMAHLITKACYLLQYDLNHCTQPFGENKVSLGIRLSAYLTIKAQRKKNASINVVC